MFLRSFLSRIRVAVPSPVYVSSPRLFSPRGITSSILRSKSNHTPTSSTMPASTSLPSSQVVDLENTMRQYLNDPFLLLKVQTTEFTEKIDTTMILLKNEENHLNNERKIIHNQLLEGKISNEVAMMLLKPIDVAMMRLEEIINKIGRANYLSAFTTWTSKNVPDMSSKVALLQDFATYRRKSYYFVDKTSFIQPLLEQQRMIFRRPRRYGKSLTLSMLKYFYYGATGLFHRLAIYEQDFKVGNFHWCPNDSTKHNFPPCPVIHLDFSFDCKSAEDFNQRLSTQLLTEAEFCGLSNFTSTNNKSPSVVLHHLLMTLSQDPLNKWKKVVILVDEYDAPVRHSSKNEKEKVLESMSSFFRVIKSLDEFVQFVYVTGIESHSLKGLCSGANNLIDFTFDPKFESLCGYTQVETTNILESFNLIADNEKLEKLQKKYHGYSYSLAPDSPDKPRETIYNPINVNEFVSSGGVFGDYWTYTSSQSLAAHFSNFNPFNSPSSCSIESLYTHLSLKQFYSSGYLDKKLVEAGYYTIKSVKDGLVTLDYPNEQIKNYVLRDYFTNERNFYIDSQEFKAVLEDLHQGEFQKYMEYDNSRIIGLPSKIRKSRLNEASWHANLSELLKLADIPHVDHLVDNQGEADVIIATMKDAVYIIEVKLSQDQNDDFKDIARKATEQIQNKKYDQIPFVQKCQSEGKKVIHVIAIGLYQAPIKDNKNVEGMIGWSLLRYSCPTTSAIIKDVELKILSSQK